MTANRRLTASVFAATALLGVATVGLASIPPRPLRSALTIVHALGFRVATDWLVVVALLAVGERYVGAGTTVDRETTGLLAAAVFLGGFAVEASPVVRLVVEPAAVETNRVVRGVTAAVRRALFPAGLFVATVLGAARLHDALYARARRASPGGLPLSLGGNRVRGASSIAVTRVAAVLAVVGGLSFGLGVGTRVALGDPYLWLAVVDAAVEALTGLVTHGVLALAFLALVVEGVGVRTLVGGAALVWVAPFAAGVFLAVLSGVVAVGLVGVTTTPVAAVEAAAIGQWPAPDSWTTLLRVGTFLAGAVGLLAVQRSASRPRRPTDAARNAGDVREA